MKHSEKIDELAAALAKAQAKYGDVTKGRTAKIASQKGAFSYHYADLGDAIDATRAALTDNGIAVTQPVRHESAAIVVTTMLMHSSGQWISEECAWPVLSTDNRSIGSGITYARRHAFLAIVGAAATDEDDDAQQARGGDHDTGRHGGMPQRAPPPKDGPTASQATEIRSLLLALGIREQPSVYLASVRDKLNLDPEDHAEATYSEVIGELRHRAKPPTVTLAPMPITDEQRAQVVNLVDAKLGTKSTPADRASYVSTIVGRDVRVVDLTSAEADVVISAMTRKGGA